MTTRLFLVVAALSALSWVCGSAAAQTMSGGSHATTRIVASPFNSGIAGVYDTDTAAGAYLRGEAAFAQGLGQYNYNTALAARQLEDADRQAMDNQLYAEKTVFEMRRLNQANWLAQNPRSTPEQIALVDQSRLPKRLSSSELDPTWGSIRWPAVLERSEFDGLRTELNEMFAHRLDGNFGIGSTEYADAQRLTHEMRTLLDQRYNSMSQMEWIHAMRFIESLGYEMRFAPGTVVGMNSR